jgi:hypothetical protein
METSPTPRVAQGDPASQAAPAWHYAAIFAIPGLLWLLNANWLFQNLGHMDPWYYFGAFRFFPRFHNLLPSYATERMTWIAPGYFFVRIFGHVTGVALLHCCLFLLSLYAVHYTLRRLTDCRTAFLSTILLGTNPFFIGAHSQDYVQGVSMASLFVSLALLMRARDTPDGNRVFIFLSAMAWTALVYSYLAWIVFTPVYLWLAVIVTGAWNPQRRLARVAGFAGAGALATTVLLWAVYRALGGSGFFLQETLKAAFTFSALTGSSLLASPTWYRQVVWLVLPAMASAMCAVWLAAPLLGQKRLPGMPSAILWFHLFCFAVLAVLALRNNPVLQVDFFSSILTPSIFLVFAIALWRTPDAIRSSLFYSVAILGAAISAAPLARLKLYQVLTHREFIVPAILALLALGCLARWRSPGPVRWTAVVLLFCGLCFAFGPSFNGPAWSKEYRGRDVSERVALAMNVVAGRLPAKQVPVFWIDNYDDPLSPEYRGIMCSFLTHSISMWHYPRLDADRRYAPATRLILITARQDVVAGASETLAKAAMPVALIGQDLVDYGGVSYWITQLEVLPLSTREQQAQ